MTRWNRARPFQMLMDISSSTNSPGVNAAATRDLRSLLMPTALSGRGVAGTSRVTASVNLSASRSFAGNRE